MKKTRSITVMTIVTVLICAAMYLVAANQDVKEKQFAAGIKQAMQDNREATTLADALLAEAHYRARVGLNP